MTADPAADPATDLAAAFGFAGPDDVPVAYMGRTREWFSALGFALGLLASAPAPRSTVPSPLRWSADPSWKRDYMNPARLAPVEIARRRAEFDRQKAIARQLRA